MPNSLQDVIIMNMARLPFVGRGMPTATSLQWIRGRPKLGWNSKGMKKRDSALSLRLGSLLSLTSAAPFSSPSPVRVLNRAQLPHLRRSCPSVSLASFNGQRLTLGGLAFGDMPVNHVSDAPETSADEPRTLRLAPEACQEHLHALVRSKTGAN